MRLREIDRQVDHRLEELYQHHLRTEDLGEIRFHQKSPDSNYLTKREAGILLSAVEKAATQAQNNGKSGKYQLALRDHSLFCGMLYAGLRIEEATALRVEDLILRRGEERVRVARGKANK